MHYLNLALARFMSILISLTGNMELTSPVTAEEIVGYIELLKRITGSTSVRVIVKAWLDRLYAGEILGFTGQSVSRADMALALALFMDQEKALVSAVIHNLGLVNAPPPQLPPASVGVIQFTRTYSGKGN